jgi:hypothetical protein
MEIARELKGRCEKGPILFVTLTVRGNHRDSLAGQVKKLTEGWRKLRKEPLWRNHISGGAIMLEIKWSSGAGGHWHPHYHVICEGGGLDRDELRRTWHRITGDSFECDVQAVREIERTMSYVTKYASKPMDASFVMRPKRLAEAIVALRGRRLCACFGSWHGTALRKKKEPLDETETITTWVYEGTLRSIEHRSSQGDAAATQLLAALERARRLRSVLSERCRSPPPDSLPVDTIHAAA